MIAPGDFAEAGAGYSSRHLNFMQEYGICGMCSAAILSIACSIALLSRTDATATHFPVVRCLAKTRLAKLFS
jgi:hypothetical protein